MTHGEAASFAGILKRYHLEIAPNLVKHVGNCRLPLTKCHSCQLAILRGVIARKRLEEQEAPVQKVVEKVVEEIVVPVAADPAYLHGDLEAAYQAGWQDRDLEVEWLKRILSESELHVGLLTQEVERLKEQIEDLGSDAWELEMNEEP